MRKQLRIGTPAIFNPYTGNRVGEALEVGTGKDYATLALALDYIATKSWLSSSALSGTVTSTSGSASVTGSGFNSLVADSYTLVGAHYQAIKSIESDGAMTLWHGAQASVTDSAATHKTLTQFTIELFEDQIVPTKTIPDGVSVLIIGHTANIKLIGNGGYLDIADYFRLEITHLTVQLDSAGASGIVAGAVGTGRGIGYLHDITVVGFGTGEILTFSAWASFTSANVVGNNYRSSVQTDYALVDETFLNTYSVSDHYLFRDVLGTDYGHPFTFNGLTSISHGEVADGQSAGIELNSGLAGKTINITNSTLIAYHSTPAGVSNEAAQPLWMPYAGTVNITDCVVDCLNSVAEIYSRGATINTTRSTRSDGSALRIATPP